MPNNTLYGLIGYPLSHSFSQQYFTRKWAAASIQHCEYRLFPLSDVAQLPLLLQQNPNIAGLNITIPYKQSVMPYLQNISPEAAAIGAVNCVVVNGQNLTGYNTDVWGFEQSLLPLLKPYHCHAFVLGAGGAAKAVQYVLQKLGLTYNIVSRKPTGQGQISYADLFTQWLPTSGIFINTTPLGMYPHPDTCPDIPYYALNEQYICYDLVYNPSPTLFLQRAAKQGAVCKNGIEMLHLQADRAWEIWQQSSI